MVQEKQTGENLNLKDSNFLKTTMNSKESVSIVFPVYNERAAIEKTIESYYNEFRGKIKFEIIVKEDGSTDGTKEILQRLSKKYPIRLFMSNARKGYQWSVIEGIKQAKYKWIFLVDSDFQYRPYDFWNMQPFMKDYDIILGKRKKRMDPFHRILMSKGFNFLIRQMFGVNYKDIEPGYRLFKRKVALGFLGKLNTLSYFTSELVLRAHFAGYKIVEVPVDHFRRKEGTTNVFHPYKIPKIIFKEMAGLWKLRRELGNK